MTTKDIAARLVDLCRQGAFETAQNELFSADAVSIEPCASPGFEKETKGLPAIIEKGHRFAAMLETTHAIGVSEPLIAGESFACIMRLDATMKGQGRMDMTELCVYTVKDGKIASEQFFQ